MRTTSALRLLLHLPAMLVVLAGVMAAQSPNTGSMIVVVTDQSRAVVTVYGTVEGVRADPQIGRSFENAQIEETPVLGRKLSTVPLLNSAFRPAKGTGDLFVNQTYVASGAGSRRTLTTTLDGANN